MNILMVHIRFAEYDRCAGDLRLTNMLRILSARHKVALHILYKPSSYLEAPHNAPYLKLMTEMGIEVKTGSLRARLRERRYDAVLIEFWYVARHLFKEIRALQPQARVIIDTEHVYFHWNYLKAKTLGKDPKAVALLSEKKEELDTYARADLVVTTTDEDGALLLRENPALAIATVPTIHDVPRIDESMERRKANSLLFVGNFSNNPANVDAIIDFCGKSLPLIRQRIPDAEVAIVGNKPPAAVRELACDYVTVTGYVPDVEPYLAAGMVSICPIRYGAGLKGKITEAMMHGLPVVTTPIGIQGMDARHGQDIMIGNTPDQIAELVVQLLEQPELRRRLSKNGRDLVIRNYSLEAVTARIDRIVASLDTIPIKRFPRPRQLTLKLRFDLADFLERHVLWRFRRPVSDSR